MKRHHLYEAIGMLMALFGAFALVAAFGPMINPGMHKVETGRSEEPLGYYVFSVSISVLILSAAWYFNRKAQQIKRDEEGRKK